MSKLCQVLAIEKGIKGRVQGETTRIYHAIQKPELFNGHAKSYRPKDEDGDKLPPDNTELLYITAQKDFANCSARANVVIDGQTILSQAPVTYLLFVEKQLTDLRTLVGKLPVLSNDENWKLDEVAGLYKTDDIVTNRTVKVQKPLVLYPATDKHPAQTQLVTEDVTAGSWNTVKQSGAIPADRRTALLDRIERVLNAVKEAREEANGAEAPKVAAGNPLLGFIFQR
jgi:hypothetical protein